MHQKITCAQFYHKVRIIILHIYIIFFGFILVHLLCVCREIKCGQCKNQNKNQITREYPIKFYITITTHSQVNTWKIRSNITLMYTYLIAKTIYYKLHYICAYSIGIRVYIETEIDNNMWQVVENETIVYSKNHVSVDSN